MPGVIIDDDVYPLHGTAIAASLQVTNAGPRVLVSEDADVGWGGGSAAGAPKCAGVGTLTLTYNDTYARVELAGSAFDPYTAVMIERSIDQIVWTTVRGATSLDVDDSGAFAINDYEFSNGVANYYRVTTLAPITCELEAVSVTPAVTNIWIKSVTRPFLNIEILTNCAMGESEVEMLRSQRPVGRRARTAIYPIVNRTYEIGVSDIRLGRDWTLLLRTFTVAARKSVDFLLASGDILYIQTPTGCATSVIEQGYVAAFDAQYVPHHRYPLRLVWEIPVIEVAAPGPDIAYAEATWQTVINAYGSWAAVLAAHATWASVLALLPDPSEVIVP